MFGIGALKSVFVLFFCGWFGGGVLEKICASGINLFVGFLRIFHLSVVWSLLSSVFKFWRRFGCLLSRFRVPSGIKVDDVIVDVTDALLYQVLQTCRQFLKKIDTPTSFIPDATISPETS